MNECLILILVGQCKRRKKRIKVAYELDTELKSGEEIECHFLLHSKSDEGEHEHASESELLEEMERLTKKVPINFRWDGG